ncbi:MAG: 50S ribosomal protein L3 [Nitrospirae bacterium CG_4_10_14_3_um_filter_44_29]|nr:50S ribosomal protein L3 [Nitrospirota bacterium]OIO29980.1 MAG: 50S ribosomal protein L3 [Nitrospirae bacterium CG1_02_44_142]PIV41889.1 MAG: 50S ribosomal protein L3 [Nitrospirae bacterium CG02_land_8_20_14_3_00_44_33]PIW89493.1 MAG: 50S ribosomal protein L3 [Nitrospirae bacterium CG_4_8_14_3_um_filter_44_28]PIX88520.1 MAG: 50S ribosomal protein L3 [Nitrospirae bacterium CG_4_10_14_3_um_filter_44_29]
MVGILGKKLGMTQIFAEGGKIVPVTVIEAGPCCVVQVKTLKKDGYEAVKVGFNEIKKEKNVNKALSGVFKKAGVKPYRLLKEFAMGDLKVGDLLTVEKFNKGDNVSVTGVSKGKGFQGVVKRHKFAGGPASHGSTFYRAPGSIGASSYPSRVWKNQKMAGHMGSERVIAKNLTVVDVKPDQNILMIRGAVPGASGAYVMIRKEI